MNKIKNKRQMNDVLSRHKMTSKLFEGMIRTIMDKPDQDVMTLDLVTLAKWKCDIELLANEKDEIDINNEQELFAHVDKVEEVFIKTVKELQYNELNLKGDFTSTVTSKFD